MTDLIRGNPLSPDLAGLLAKAKAQWDAMTPEQKEEMLRAQAESWVRAEMSWPKPKFKYENGAKVYETWEDYCND